MVIPVFRIFDEAKAREFYIDWVGFQVDWEHRFDDNAPLYMQVSRGDIKLHLSEHHGDACPGSKAFIEFENLPADLGSFEASLDNNLRAKNTYYGDLISGSILTPLKVIPVKKNAFIDYMKSIGKLGGQNKIPRLSNDRSIADKLKK